MLGVVNAKVPGTEAAPPANVDDASVWPWLMALAVGQVLTVGVYVAFAWEICANP